MANIFEIIFKGTNQTDPGAAGAKKNLDGVAQSAKGVGSAMDMAMGVLASTQMQRFSDASGRFLKTMMDEAGEAQAIMAQLEAVIKSTGGVAGISADEINDMATAIANVTAVEDDAIIAGQTVLLQFTKIGEETFPAATEAMLDLATRMKIDIPSAAKLVGKALEGEFAGLSRYGIVFDDTTKGIIDNLFKVGKTAEAQQLIIDELNKRFGGSAKAAASTWSGMMEGLKNDVKNAFEEMGNVIAKNPKVLEALVAIRGIIQDTTKAFGELPEGAQAAMVGVVALIAGLMSAAPALFSLFMLVKGGGPIIKLLGTAFLWLVDIIGWVVGNAWGLLFRFFAWLAGPAIAALPGIFASIFSAIGAAIMSPLTPFILLAIGIAAFVVILVTCRDEIKRSFLMIASIIAAALKRAGYELGRFGAIVANWAAGLLNTLGAWFTRIGRGIVEGIWTGIQSAWEWLKTNIAIALDNLLKWIQDKIGAHSYSKLYAEQVGLPMAQGVQVGFSEGLGLGTPTFGASLTPAYATAFSGAAASGSSIQVGTVRVYGELSREARHRMRQEADEIAYNAVKMTMGRGRR